MACWVGPSARAVVRKAGYSSTVSTSRRCSSRSTLGRAIRAHGLLAMRVLMAGQPVGARHRVVGPGGRGPRQPGVGDRAQPPLDVGAADLQRVQATAGGPGPPARQVGRIGLLGRELVPGQPQVARSSQAACPDVGRTTVATATDDLPVRVGSATPVGRPPRPAAETAGPRRATAFSAAENNAGGPRIHPVEGQPRLSVTQRNERGTTHCHTHGGFRGHGTSVQMPRLRLCACSLDRSTIHQSDVLAVVLCGRRPTKEY